MTDLPQYQTAVQFDHWLGSPNQPNTLLSYEQVMAYDETETMPPAILKALFGKGIHTYFVPVAYGGKLASFEEMMALLKMLSRRDAAVTVGFGFATYVGAVNTWVGGTEEQKQQLAQYILNGGRIATTFNEGAHGNDFLHFETTAHPQDNKFILSGEKWLNANVPHAEQLTVYARTKQEGGPRGFTIFSFPKTDLESGQLETLPRVKTLGLRANHVSGLRLQEAKVPATAVISKVGHGLELALRAFQITRTLAPAIALGGVDTALRTTVSFAHSRQLYGDTVWHIPHAQQTLTQAFVDLLVCDCVSTTAVRALHTATNQMSHWSCVSKAFVTDWSQRILKEVSTILGARYYLREEHHAGIFQKIVRDYPFTSIVHGSGIICLSSLAAQLRHLLKERPLTPAHQQRLRTTYSLHEPLPPFNPQNLRVANPKQSDPFVILPHLPQLLAESNIQDEAFEQLLHQFVTHLQKQFANLAHTIDQLEALYPHETVSKTPEMFDLAFRYCELHSALSCLYVWLYNHPSHAGAFAQGAWLLLALNKLVKPLLSHAQQQQYLTQTATYLQTLYQEKKLFSIVPIHLAEGVTNA